MAASELFDIRTALWKRAWEQSLPYNEFIKTGTPAHQSRWQAYRESLSLAPHHQDIVKGFSRELNVLVLAGMWCGDCARQCPMLDVIGTLSPRMNLRFIDNQADSELRDELRIHGAARVPVVLSLSEDFFEVGRSLDRTLAAYQRKARTELGDACDAGIVPPSADELGLEMAQWVEHFERQQILLRVSPFLRRRHND